MSLENFLDFDLGNIIWTYCKYTLNSEEVEKKWDGYNVETVTFWNINDIICQVLHTLYAINV